MSDFTSEFRKELKDLINKHSLENGSNTPDFILADFIDNCLKAFDMGVIRREDWYKDNKKEATG